ncbi:hypothetical protein CAEBREN_01052 [Caenorhabditis brenneri]|uniref:Uncharacterized protein n=1 Tax=Caenorhabditis brenneri TaxID=135651 RepID=G0NZ31_CAEBE|nr:hypothetical protein CAEBREN_01052 [Caenorhabditis brenneri]
MIDEDEKPVFKKQWKYKSTQVLRDLMKMLSKSTDPVQTAKLARRITVNFTDHLHLGYSKCCVPCKEEFEETKEMELELAMRRSYELLDDPPPSIQPLEYEKIKTGKTEKQVLDLLQSEQLELMYFYADQVLPLKRMSKRLLSAWRWLKFLCVFSIYFSLIICTAVFAFRYYSYGEFNDRFYMITTPFTTFYFCARAYGASAQASNFRFSQKKRETLENHRRDLVFSSWLTALSVERYIYRTGGNLKFEESILSKITNLR